MRRALSFMCRAVSCSLWVGLLLGGLATLSYGQSVGDLLAGSVQLTGGPVSFEIITALPGSQPLPATNTDAQIEWNDDELYTTKIVVSTTCPDQSFDLYVQALSPTRGTAQPEVQLVNGGLPADLIRDIPSELLCPLFDCAGTATLRYRAEVAVEQGAGSDAHTVTYTILAQ